MKGEVDRYETTGQMQAEEINRLNAERSQTTEEGIPISKETVNRLVEKVDQLRFEYLEKERELTVLKSELVVKEDSYHTQSSLLSKELTSLKDSLALQVKESDTLREALTTARRSQQLADDQQHLKLD